MCTDQEHRCWIIEFIAVLIDAGGNLRFGTDILISDLI